MGDTGTAGQRHGAGIDRTEEWEELRRRHLAPDGERPPSSARGVHHVALFCADVERTIGFYQGVLEFPLTELFENRDYQGSTHFFFDIGGTDSLAFFWFPDAPDGVPGISAPAARPDNGDLVSAVGSMNHIAFQVAPERIDEYRQALVDEGVACSDVINHDDSEWTISEDMYPGVYVRSVYFQDPDGILLELAAWTRGFTSDDVAHAPATAAGERAATPSTVAVAAEAL